MDQDRNLLFGVFAAQLKRVSPDKIIEIAAAWAIDRTRGLADRFVADGVLDWKDCKLIQHLVDEAIGAHNGDVHATLAAFGGQEQIASTFQNSLVLTKSGDVLPATTASDGGFLDSLSDIPGVHEQPGRYTRQSEHARGGMGRVLLVHDEHLGRDIALKELLPSLSSTGDPSSPIRQSFPYISRFLQEARITGQLEHPAIVPVYELGHRLDGSLYYTMKLVRGRTLARAIRDAGGLSERLGLLPHMVDLCHAIAYAHSRKVIHRDIKPGNIMVGEFGETVVLDWGLAKHLGEEDAHEDGLLDTLRALSLGDEAALFNTEYGQALGTPVYMPPEQAKGQLEQIDQRSDVYALGAVLYELLTGTVPFDGKSIQQILRQVIEELPRDILNIEPNAPPELVAISMRALNKHPHDRYQSARELAEDIQRFQNGAPVSAYKYGVIDVVWRFLDAHRNAFLSCIATIVLVAVTVIVLNLRIRDERDAARALVTRLETLPSSFESRSGSPAKTAIQIGCARISIEGDVGVILPEQARVSLLGTIESRFAGSALAISRASGGNDEGCMELLVILQRQGAEIGTSMELRSLAGETLAKTNVATSPNNLQEIREKTLIELATELLAAIEKNGTRNVEQNKAAVD